MQVTASADLHVAPWRHELTPGAGTDARRAWRGSYVRRIAAADALAIALAALAGYQVRFGSTAEHVQRAPFGLAILLLSVLWLGAMFVSRSYEERFLWVGPEEFRRVFFAAALLLATVGTLSWALKLEVARGFVVIALPLATVLTLLHRSLQRLWVRRARVRGRLHQRALLVGHRSGVAALHQQMVREAHHGYQVIGCCLPPSSDGSGFLAGPPVLGDLDMVAAVVRRYEVDTVAVLPCPELEGPALRRLGWDLEKTRTELLLAPAVTEIVGSRVRIRPACGLPLLHVERPELRGVRRLTKEAVDRTLAALLVLLLAPALVVVALAIRLDDGGPVFFRQARVGKDGQPFSMLKFRTMVPEAERRLAELTAVDEGNGVLFKVRRDPRVTRMGRHLRRYSIDEVPQLLNVVRGDMSLVGPRPPLPSEVERYGSDMHRRFLVKPGITGLWQVSGRSDLSWDDSVRIDVRYVENWSLTFDFMILWKTLGAVLRGPGAY